MSDPQIQGYARAVFEIARAEGNLDEVEDELFRFARLIDREGELRMALTDASRPAAQRQKLIEELLEGKVSSPTALLIGFVVGSGRASQLTEIVSQMLEIAAEEKKHVVAEVTSAIPLDETQRARLAEALSRATGLDVEVHVMVDPSILGGIIAKVKDRLIDGSISGRLEQMREQVSAARAGG